MRPILMTAAFLLMLQTTASTQESRRSAGGFDLNLHALFGYSDFEDHGHTGPGVGIGLGYNVLAGLGVELRGAYRRWHNTNYAPLHLGVRYQVPCGPIILAPFVGAGGGVLFGPGLGIGGASWEVGARSYLPLDGMRLFVEASYARGMEFHPSGFNMFGIGGGVSL